MLKRLGSLNDILLKYGVASILLAVPLYPKFPFMRIPGTYVSIRLEDFLIAIVSLAYIIKVLPRLKSIIKEPINLAILIFLGIGAVSLLSAVFVTDTIVLHIGILHWARRLEYFLPLLIGIEVMRRKDTKLLEFFLKCLMVTVIFAFLYGAGQKYLGWPVIITQNEEYAKGIALRWIPGSHISSTFAGHYDLASFLVLLLPILISQAVVLKGRITKVLLTAIIFLGLWLLVNAISRISIVSYLTGATVSLIFLKKYKFIPVVLGISILFFSLSSDLLSRYMRIIEVTRRNVLIDSLFYVPSVEIAEASEDGAIRMRPLPSPTPQPVFEDRSTSIRLNVEWPRALRAFSKTPLLGTGYSSITLATDNDFLRLLGEVGILGFAGFFLIFLRIGRKILTVLPLHKNFEGIELAYLAGVVGALPGVFLNAFFIDVFEASKFAIIFWLLMGFAIALMTKSEYE